MWDDSMAAWSVQCNRAVKGAQLADGEMDDGRWTRFAPDQGVLGIRFLPAINWTPDGNVWQQQERADGQTPIIVQPYRAHRTPQRERQPSGQINGVPYYVIPLANNEK